MSEIDISRIDGIKRSATRTKRLMRSLARHQGTQATLTAIRADMAANDTDSLDTDRMRAPSFKLILTAVGNLAYRRHDGICVVPIGCLKD